MPFTPPKPLPPPPPDVVGAPVLVVDDERVWRVILETDLRMLGYRVVLAEDATQALVKAREAKPQVAIIDLMLPEPFDGWALLAALKEQGTSVPVVFYTANPELPNRAIEDGVVGYVSKADDRADLYTLLPQAILDARARRR